MVALKITANFSRSSNCWFIAEAVRIVLLQTASELVHNLQDSPTKSIDPRLKRCVERLVMKEHRKIDSIVLKSMVITDQMGPLQEVT